MNIKDNWKTLEAWLQANCPELYDCLNPGATESEIEQAEERLDVAWPDDLKTFYRVHNGQDAEGPWLFDLTEFLSIERILDEHQVWKDLLDGGDFADFDSDPGVGVKGDWWNNLWIPLTYNGAGDHLCVDLDPAPEGTRGQIIEMWHDMEERPVVAKSLDEWFANFVNEVTAGLYDFSDEDGGLMKKEG